MRLNLFDTGSASDFINHRSPLYPRAKARKALGDVMGICAPVLGELWGGIYLSASQQRNEARLLQNRKAFKVWPYTEAAAREYGRLYALLRRTGRMIQQVDLQVAAIALTMGNCIVISMDKDLLAVPGLVVENWSIP